MSNPSRRVDSTNNRNGARPPTAVGPSRRSLRRHPPVGRAAAIGHDVAGDQQQVRAGDRAGDRGEHGERRRRARNPSQAPSCAPAIAQASPATFGFATSTHGQVGPEPDRDRDRRHDHQRGVDRERGDDDHRHQRAGEPAAEPEHERRTRSAARRSRPARAARAGGPATRHPPATAPREREADHRADEPLRQRAVCVTSGREVDRLPRVARVVDLARGRGTW